MIHKYGKPLNLGHSDLEFLFDGPVVIQEKIDGSQLSFGIIEGELHIRSRGQTITNLDTNTGMFGKAIKEIKEIQHLLTEGVIYRGEYLQSPKHNTLAYSRVPAHNIILFDVEWTDGSYATSEQLQKEGKLLGLETVPVFYEGEFRPTQDALDNFLQTESVLGGTTLEGVVIKNYAHHDKNEKTLMGKYVSEKFRETHQNKGKKLVVDVVQDIVDGYNLEARWLKALQHLEENSSLEYSPKDIGKLMQELHTDFEEECAGEIKEMLYKHYRKQILRGISAGFPDWYKQYLAFGQQK